MYYNAHVNFCVSQTKPNDSFSFISEGTEAEETGNK